MSDFAAIRFQPQRPLLRELSADRLNTILQEIRRNKPKGERGITVRQSGDGTYIGLAASLPAGKGGAPTTTHPFQIASRQNPDNANQYLVTVRPGTLNNVLASNWNTEETCGAEELKYVVLTATATANAIVSTLLSLEASPPTAEQPPVKWGLPTEFTVLVGLVLGPLVWQVVYDNLSYAGAKRITTDREDPQPGELPYDNFYVWQLQPTLSVAP
jgi:hypothetical protein